VVRADLTPGQQLAQTAHAVVQFSQDHSDQFQDWTKKSNYIVCLSCPDESTLKKLYQKLPSETVYKALWGEADLANQSTAFAVCGEYKAIRSVLGALPLALRGLGGAV
jgi:peptidyl-tRNA hydrolase